jgi:ribokinase
VVADALVGSARDAAEAFVAGSLDHPPALIVRTEGLAGGSWDQDGEHRRWKSRVPWADGDDDGRPPAADDYGAGDSFAAALSYALAAGMPAAEAIAFAARCGAACASGRGPYTAQLTHADLVG